MKKIALLLVCFLMSLAYTAIADTCGDYKYTLLDDGTAEITGYTGTSVIVDIPEKLDGKFVSSIGASSFRDCECIISVTIPDSVKIIDDKAFYSCGSLTSVILPDSIRTIGNEAFYGCERLISIKIPDGVTSIGDYAFYSIDTLTSITIPDSVMSIGANPFCGCNPLIEINVSPQHPAFEMIDGVLFSKADKRLIYYPRGSASSSYVIPQGIAVIGDAAFKLSENLNTVIIPDSVTTIGSQAFMASFDDLTVIIPDSVTTIGAGAFIMCTNLSLIVESNSYAEQYAIEKNYNYTPITSSEKTLMNEHKEERIMGYLIIGLICVIAIVAIVRYPVKQRNKKSKEESSSYSSSPSNYSTTVNTSSASNKPTEEVSSTSAYTTTSTSTPVSNSSFQVSSQEDVTLTGISVITKDIVRMYPLLTNLTIGAGVYRIERDAFRECKRLEKIVIDTDLDEIGRSAFEDLEELREVVGINRVRKIGEWAFCTCSSLTTVTSSNNSGILEEIGECAFVNCKRLSIVNLPNRPIIYGVNCFRDCEAILTVNALNYAKEIGPYAFYGCKSLISALMYGSLTKIGEAAFFGCSNLKYVNIPEGTTSIGDGAFGCCHFEEISFPNSATHIGSGVLRASIYYLKSLSLPEREKHRLNDILGLDNEGYEDKYVSKIEIKYIPQNQNTNNEVEVSAETKTDNSPVSPENSSNTEPQLSKFQQLLNRAESNDPEAMFEVGRAYENGEDVEKDEQKAFYWFEKASELGHAIASNLCGIYCSKANDASRSFEYFKKAYNLGNIDAAINLGNCYENGKGTNKDLNAAIDCYNFALNKGYNSGAYCLGFLYMDAGDEKNEKLYFAKAAEMNHPHGTAVYGIILQQEGKHAQAFEYFKKAKELGNAQDALLLGSCYENGKGVEKNIDTAIECYKFALEKGDSRGANNLCYIYEVMGDIEKVKFYSSKSMELNDSSGFHTYGSCLEKEKNYTEALKYYQKGYELNNEVAAWRLGLLYQNGYGTQKDLLKAVDLFRFAIDNGCVAAINSLAFICNDDEFKGLDEFTKFKYLKMADDAGYEGYCCALAERYYYGEGVEKNIHKCLEYAEKVYMQNKNCTDTLLAVSRSHDAFKCTIMINHIFEWERSNPEIANACVAYFTKLADYGDIGYIDKIAELSLFDEAYCDYSKAWKYSQQLINQVQKSDYASDLKSSLESKGHLYIGIMLAEGLGVQRDIQQGLVHLRKAKDLGNKNAEKILNDL